MKKSSSKKKIESRKELSTFDENSDTDLEVIKVLTPKSTSDNKRKSTSIPRKDTTSKRKKITPTNDVLMLKIDHKQKNKTCFTFKYFKLILKGV